MNIKGSKHLTLGERIVISELLIQNKSLNEIAEAINKDPRTISKEIKRSRTQKINNRYKFSKNYPKYCKKSFRFPFVCVSCNKEVRVIININLAMIHNSLKRNINFLYKIQEQVLIAL